MSLVGTKLYYADCFHPAMFFQMSSIFRYMFGSENQTCLDLEVKCVVAGDAEAKIDRYAWASLE